MKKIFILLCCFSALGAKAQTPVASYGFLSVSGTQLVSQSGQPVALHGVSFGWHCFWPRFYNPQAVEWLAKDWHATVVRAAIGVEPKGGYINDPKTAVKCAEAVIDGAIKSGIYVIVDWHSHHINQDSAELFFTTIAKKYHQYPNIIYELFNEPVYASWTDVKSYSEKLIALIRKYDKKNVILVGCPHWDQDINLPAADPIKGFSNIMYTLHFYAGTHREELRRRSDSALAKGLPIFISESGGMDASGTGGLDTAEWHKWIRWADERKISWVVWSISDKEGETCSMIKNTAPATGGWTDDDLTLTGIYTKELLRKEY
jgi:endoglucanase